MRSKNFWCQCCSTGASGSIGKLCRTLSEFHSISGSCKGGLTIHILLTTDRQWLEMVLVIVFCIQPFPCHLFTQMHLVFEVLYLTQFLLDSLRSWTVHSYIQSWCLIHSTPKYYSIFNLCFWALGVIVANQTAVANAEHHRIPWYCAWTSFSTTYL